MLNIPTARKSTKGSIVSLVFTLLISSAALSAELEMKNQALTVAKNNGVKKCLKAIESVTTEFLKGSDNHSARSTWDPNDPDNGVYTTVIEVAYEWGSLTTSATFAPVISGTCHVITNQLYHTTKSCPDFVKEVFPNASYMGKMAKELHRFETDDLSIFLTPTHSGCMTLKKEHTREAFN